MATLSAVQDPPEPLLLRLVTALVTAIALAGCGDETPQAEKAQRDPGVEAGHGGSESGVAGLGGSQEGRPGGNAEAGATMEPLSPHLLETNPADGSTDIYPFPLPDGLSISLTFSEAISPEVSELSLRSEGGMENEVPIEWADSGREALVTIAANPLTGAPPLLDLTGYALDLSLLTSQRGVPLDPQQNLTGGALHFTTGAFDALLNHACGHVKLGPFQSAVAAEMPSTLTVPTDMGHINYSITLPQTAAGYEGYTRVTTLMGRSYHFLFDSQIPAALVSGSAEGPLPIQPAAAACDGITHRAVFSAEADEELFLHLGPIATSSLHMIVEIVSDG